MILRVCWSYLFQSFHVSVSDAPKNQKLSAPRTNSKRNGICDEQFSIKMHWEIQNNLVCRYNLEIHFDFHSSIMYQVCLMKLPTLSSKVLYRHNFEFQHKISILIRFFTFHFFSFRQNLPNWRVATLRAQAGGGSTARGPYCIA